MKEFGKVTHRPEGFQVKFERIFAFDIETVWSALTDPKKLALWFTDIEMDFREGGQIMIQFRDADKTKSYGKIQRIKKPSLFEYTWEDELATWELLAEGENTRLIFTYRKLPDSYASSATAGWHILLDQLDTVLNGRTQPYPFGTADERSEKMKAVYAERLEKEFPILKSKIMNTKPFTLERTYPVPARKVWEAITDKAKMKQWYFDLNEFRPQVGFEFSFAGQGSKGEKYIHLCKILEVVENKKLSYSWTYKDYPGYSVVTFELFEEEKNKTRLKLTHAGLETFPGTGDFAPASFEAGWTELIGKLLKNFLEKE